MLKAGAVEVCITPPIGVELAGYGPRLGRYSTDIHDHLMGQALVLDDGQTRVAMVTCDLIALSPAFVRQVRWLVHRRTGIPPEHVMLACIHSHTAPTTQPFHDWGSPDRSYIRMVARHLAGAVVAATLKLQPARLSVGRGTHEALAWNRTGGGLVDPAVEVLRIETAAGEPLALLVHYACHPVILGPKPIISADYPGALRSHLARRYPGAVILFANGACGDIDPATNREVWGRGTFEDVDAAGAGLAASAGEAADGAVPIEPPRIAVRQGSLEMAYAVPSLEEVRQHIAHFQAEARRPGRRSERFEEVTGEVQMPRFWLGYYRSLERRLLAHELPAQDQAELQAFCLGEQAVLLAIPAEVYTGEGMAIRAGSSFPHTLPVCYANGLVGYIPPAEEFARGSYAARMAAAVYGGPPFQPDIAERLVRSVLSLVRG